MLSIDQPSSKIVLILRACILLVVPLVGIVLAILVYRGLEGARAAIKAAEDEGTELLGEEYEDELPSLHSTDTALSSGRLASSGICYLMIIAWSLVFIATFFALLLSIICCM